ncbi:protein refolding chaperone Spy/CpxP family [Saccharicrinis carchari]|uniref:Protein refolding chaperone Spy/CpxP family n=1 Tax=Saccharicrinis carchari TaxID=1168039 RepID=A0A521E1V1_SACCC|nr:Spy/CpxP family protein refolding chaperone [Saccharicrinis carchari]SMO77815.1 protein refolding chaperone Spy/CpxP family [Saccharicrinis carchari]
MKKNSLHKIITLFALFGVLIIGSAWGYGDGQGRRANAGNGDFRAMRGLDLTDAQQEQIKALRVDFMKEMTPQRNNMRIKMAELNAASVGDNVDTQAVNKLLDEIGAIKTDMAKKQFANKQKVRSVLSDEQRVMFDALCNQGMRGGIKGKALGQGRRGNKGNFSQGYRGQGQGRGFDKQGQRSTGRGMGKPAL